MQKSKLPPVTFKTGVFTFEEGSVHFEKVGGKMVAFIADPTGKIIKKFRHNSRPAGLTICSRSLATQLMRKALAEPGNS